jgi:probable HAF family extracellular repeat protein
LGKPESPLRSDEEETMKSRTWIQTFLVSLFAMLAITAQASIVYTPVNVTLPTNGFYAIDLNHDGIADFTFQTESGFAICPGGAERYHTRLRVRPTTGGIMGTRDADALQSGIQIDSGQTFWGSTALMYEKYFGPGCGQFDPGQWSNVRLLYLGLEFQVNGQIHYGWAQLTTNSSTGVDTLYGFAYETVAGQPIKTGQRFGAPDEPGIGPDSVEPEDLGASASVVLPLSTAPQPQLPGYAGTATPIGMAAQEEQQLNHRLPRYTVTDLGTLGGTFSVAGGINNRGWVDGYSTLAGDQSQHAFLWRNDAMTDLGTLGGPNSVAYQPLNERGEVGGTAETLTLDPLREDFCDLGTHLVCLPYLWREGVMIPLPTLGGSNGDSKTFNNRGQVVGYTENTIQDPACNPPQVLDFEAVIWEPKQSKIKITGLLPLPGDTIGIAFAINDKSQVVGITGSCSFGVVHAVLWQNGAVTDLGNLGGTTDNWAEAINNQGQAVGWSNLPGDMTYHTFLWTEDKGMQDLGTLPGDFASAAGGINSKGQVVGTSYDASGNPRAFLWQRGVMTDLNTLIPAGSPLFLLDGNGVNSQGEIVGDALQISTGEVHAYLATPCNGNGNDREGCEDGAQGSATAGIAPDGRPKIALSDNVRNLLSQQRLRRYHSLSQPKAPRD